MAAPEWIQAAYSRVTLSAYRRLAQRSGGAALDRAGLLLVSGPHPDALITNVAFRIDADADASDSLKLARDHYAELGYRFAFSTSADRDADLEAAAAGEGWIRVLDLPAMIIDSPITALARPDGSNLRRADPALDGRPFGEIAGACFADDDREAESYRMLFADGNLLGGTDMAAVIASVDSRDVAAAWMTVDGDAGLVGWVGTLADYRRRGLGAWVTQAVTNEAFARGARIVVLQASPQGLRVYERLGYRTIGLDRVWLPPG
jgi:ribosomal protein S18 acetylase RimI-like enzyme